MKNYDTVFFVNTHTHCASAYEENHTFLTFTAPAMHFF